MRDEAGDTKHERESDAGLHGGVRREAMEGETRLVQEGKRVFVDASARNVQCHCLARLETRAHRK